MSTSVLIVVKIPTVEQQVIDNKGEGFNQSVKQLNFTPLYDRLRLALQQINITDAVWQLCQSNSAWRVSFTCSLDSTDSVLKILASKSIGSYKNTYIGILPYSFLLQDDDSADDLFTHQPKKSITKSIGGDGLKNGKINEAYESDGDSVVQPSPGSSFDFKNFQSKFLKSITARLTVAQVASSIKSNSELTFDFVIYVLMASWIAAMGLIENSIVNLVAAMLVSPLMGPVLAVTFGTMVRANDIRNLGLRNAAIGFLIPIVFGYIFGIVASSVLTEDHSRIFPTDEMKARGDLRNLLIGTLVALPSGAAVSLSILSGAQASLIGVAISASLLPPCVNAGLLWSHATVQFIHSINEDKIPVNLTGHMVSIQPSLIPPSNYQALHYHDNIVSECLALGFVSFCLTLVNILSIFCAGLLFLKIKEITPLSRLSSTTARFFREDIKIAREHNLNSRRKSTTSEMSLGEEIVREWADATGLNANGVLVGDEAERKIIQLHTLQDMMDDVNSDSLIQTLRRDSHSISPASPADMEMWHRKRLPFTERSNSVAGNLFRRRQTVSFTPSFAAVSSTSINLPGKKDDIPMSNIFRRQTSHALFKELANADHLPFSMWPKTQRDFTPPTPATPSFADQEKYRQISQSALRLYEKEIKKQPSSTADEKEEAESDEAKTLF